MILIALTIRINISSVNLPNEKISLPGETTIIDDWEDTIIPVDTITTEGNPLVNLPFENGVVIKEFMTYKNAYIAIGEDKNIPFMQMIYVEGNQITEKGIPYLFNDGVGKIVDVTLNDYYISATIENGESTYTQDFIEQDDKFIPLFVKQIQYNYNKNISIIPTYLVIHETGNTSVGADANAHYRYWNNNDTANASTHFVVDNKEIYQMLALDQSAWHVGDNRGYSNITNVNSIGIEIAVNADGDYDIARQNSIDLTINIMKSLNMDISQLKRHYDASGKNCPEIMLRHPELWIDFVAQVEQGLSS